MFILQLRVMRWLNLSLRLPAKKGLLRGGGRCWEGKSNLLIDVILTICYLSGNVG